ncbi:hypothetical protein TIFTF001_016965 [Ficus carica]|uniref:Uncharacterized protein n=1 Tax=Ficus carica TaxID=3494 RepID=A0AA88DAA9_FICCA|nr:hypothetical protein TIFTF001_016965 [Ficus carica]
MIRSRTSFHVLNQASFLVLYRPITRAGLIHGLSWIGLAAPITPWLCTTEVLVERKLMTYVLAVDIDMNLVPNLVQIEEDREASLAFWGIEPRIFDGTHGAAALAEWLHDMEILFKLCHIEAHLESSDYSKIWTTACLACLSKRVYGPLLPAVQRRHDRPMIQAIQILINRLPPEVMQFTPPTTFEMTLDEMIEAIMGAEGIPPQEEDAEMDPADHLVDSEENMENPLLSIITSDNKDGDEEDEDSEERLIGDDDDDEDTNSIVFSDISSE